MFKYWQSDDGKYSYFTRGCAANVEESVKLLWGLRPYFDSFIIVNTCLVKEKQEHSIIEVTKELVKRKGKNTKVFITGCSVTINPHLYEGLGIIIPNKDKFNPVAYGLPEDTELASTVFNKSDVAMVEIQSGCNCQCTYCIIPKARGKSVSVAYRDIRKQIDDAVKQGHKKVKLVGTNLTQYDHNGMKLSDLCEQILDNYPEISCLQLEFIEPESSEMERMMDLIRRNNRMEARLEMGAQSFCDSVLKRMKRGSSQARFKELYKLAGKDINLVPDIMVGFPGETEEEFMETYNFIKNNGITDLHVHSFSPRPGTPAYDMDNQVPEEVKLKRSLTLRDLARNNRTCKPTSGRELKRIFQFELTQECKNNCQFCYNSGCKSKVDPDKIDNLLRVHSFLNSDEVTGYDGLGLIGGELFDGQFSSYVEELLFREIFPVALYSFRDKHCELRVSSALMMNDPSFMIDVLKGTTVSTIFDYSTINICTSYDTRGRFNTEKQLNNWKRNMKLLKEVFPAILLHTEIILTQDFIDKSLNGEFDLEEFSREYDTGIDFIEPNSGFYYKDKYEMSKHLPWFFPKRESFIDFVMMLRDSDYSNVHSLLDLYLRADSLVMKVNGKMVRFDNRNTVRENLPCHIVEKSGYIDSNIRMRDDVITLLGD